MIIFSPRCRKQPEYPASGFLPPSFIFRQIILATLFIKKESGKTALEYIQLRLIELAKEKIFYTEKSINEVAYELGFKYPQHFSRFFKQHVGFTPNEYRHIN
jgi:AraC-like DNA-binding protein